MIKKLLLIFMLGIFASCQKNLNSVTEPAAPDTINNIVFSVSKLDSYESLPPSKAKEKYDVLGFGYDITGKLEDSSAVRAQVIDVSTYAAAYPQEVNNSGTTSSGARLSYGKNADDYLRTLSLQSHSNKDSLLFNNAITNYFPNPDALTADFVYAQYNYRFVWRRYGSIWSSVKSNRYLNANFLNDVQHLTAENVIKKYGTHILSRISLGGKFVVRFQARVSGEDKLHLAMVGFTYALKKVFALNSEYLDKLKPTEVNAISDPKLVYEVVGGIPSNVTKKITTKGDIIWPYDWQSTLSEGNAVFIEIAPDGLTPLYNMINDPVKKIEIKNYITSYIQKNQSKL